ncbi:hypothetical protein NQ314_004089 [Rhamnusium bicolor]|uniref:Ubiquinone biosynthesis protein n=1 Tax=Rhamnusium bicolor TaxID=1586634 RepID=A0AAV8ZK45_9CUCU|nr:hypothetical protein NQ314_004089 [Rhamnusium bicolor]
MEYPYKGKTNIFCFKLFLIIYDYGNIKGVYARGTPCTYRIWAAYTFNCTQTTSNQQNGETYEEDIRNKILAASLAFVSELGWSKEALSAGAESVGYPRITHGMFSRGGSDLVHYFQTSSNLKLVEILKKFQSEHRDKPIPPGEFAERAIQARLKMIIPYINKWPQAIAIMSLPPNFNWYIRRIGIAAVYKATELYMIQDKSQKYEATWTFLNRRLIEAVQLHDLLNKSDVKNQTAKDTAQAVFVTVSYS